MTPIVAFCIAEKRGWGASKIQSNPGLGWLGLGLGLGLGYGLV